jgi:hypothetical protein
MLRKVTIIFLNSNKPCFSLIGYLLNNHFDFTDAESPSDLYQRWKSAGDPPMDDVRCWVLLKTPASSVWVEVVLDIPNFFDLIKTFFEDEVSIEFRAKGTPSPNSSPHSDPTKESDVGTAETVQVAESLSTLGLNDAQSTPTEAIDFSDLINDKDPFTMEGVEKIEDPLLLRFPKEEITGGQDIMCVSLDSFEQFVRAEVDAGKSLIDLELHRVMCKGGRELSFVLCMDVWMLSILEHPREIRNNFRGCLKCSIMRKYQLRGMKKDKELWQRVHFWVSDFLDFKASYERLTLPLEDDITPFMSPYYFSKEEAEILGSLLMPNTADLHDTMSIMLEAKAGGGALEVCASHDIAPVLLIGFEIKKGFHKDKNFNKGQEVVN